MKQKHTAAHLQKKILTFFSSGNKQIFRKGDIILRAGESVPSVYYLLSGYVRIVHHHESLDAVTLHMFRPGSFFPLVNVFSEKESSFTFEALSPVAVYVRKKTQVREFLESNPKVLLDVMERLLSGMEGLLNRLTLLSTHSAYEKVTSLLMYVARSIGVSGASGVRIPISLSHKDIASWVGTTRETVSLQMEELRKHDRIFYNGRTLYVRA